MATATKTVPRRASGTSIKKLIRETEDGVAFDLGTLYVYPDRAAFLGFADGTKWPLADPYQVVQVICGGLLRPMQQMAKRKQTQR